MTVPLRFFNTLSRKVEAFEPRVPGKAGLYTCGPTVYAYAHIGNLRTYLFEDLLRRALIKAGYDVTHICNITDVGHLTSDSDDTGDDKMEQGAKREGRSVWELAQFYTDAFQADLKRLNVIPATAWPRATEHVPEQIAMVQTLIDKGFGYQADDGIYYDTSKFPRYGDFARKDLRGQEAGARVACADGKRNNSDFALWKFSPAGSKRLMEWDSPWGKGFPGWHIECSAMSVKYLGEQFDLHCGGIDHIPVHHSNEIAQTEAVTEKVPWVNYWLHGEFLVMDKAKMSKSSGEFLTLQRVIDRGFEALDYRFLCLQAHYRQQLAFTFESLESAKTGRKNLLDLFKDLGPSTPQDIEEAEGHPYWTEFWKEIASDLNGPRALAKTWELGKDQTLRPGLKAAIAAEMDSLLGLDLLLPAVTAAPLSPQAQLLLDERAAARAAKDFGKSDLLREQLTKLGIVVKDTAKGQEWSR